MNQPAKQNEPRDMPIGMRDTTCFLIVDDKYEKEIALAYIAKTYPETKARTYFQLPLNRLREDDVVIAIGRPPGRSPASRTEKNQHGFRETVNVPPASLAEECVETKPLELKPFYSRSDDGYDNEMRINEFICAFGPLVTGRFVASVMYNEKTMPGKLTLRP